MIHNVSDKTLVKIQDQCYAVEQSLRKGHVTDAINMLQSMVYTINMLKVEIEKHDGK